MPLIIRAIITGFGYKIGAELGRYVAERVGLSKPKDKPAEDDMPEGLPREPPTGGDDDPDDGDEDQGSQGPVRAA